MDTIKKINNYLNENADMIKLKKIVEKFSSKQSYTKGSFK